MRGKPCNRRTRITVKHILDSLAMGRTIDDLLKAHGRITREDVLAALAFASDSVRLATLPIPMI